jgi:hypothetical protein
MTKTSMRPTQRGMNMHVRRRQCVSGTAVLVLVAVACSFAWSQPDQPSATAWYQHYERGVTLVEEGRGGEAKAALEEALRLKADEGLRVRTQGPRYVDYLPHLYLAIACHMSGDVPAARLHLADAERSGVTAQSETGTRLLAAFRALLAFTRDLPAPQAEEPPAAPTPEAPPRFTVFERKPVVLSDSEFERLQKDVLSRCRLSVATPRRHAPWYYYYELGLELERHGDNQRALDALIEAAQDKPGPQQLARIYGVWFLDYLPYIAIAKAHARLGNRECALDALAVSRRLRETDEDDAELKELLSELRSDK